MEIKGKYNTAKVFANELEDACRQQIQQYVDSAISEYANIAIMPDTYSGKGCVIGFTQTITDKVCPNLVGVDIGCGMLCAKLKTDLDPHDFLEKCKNVPCGYAHHHAVAVTKFDYSDFVTDIKHLTTKADCRDSLNLSIGSLGSGNHFIELNQNERGEMYVVIHSGSRYLGQIVCNNYLKECLELDGFKYLKSQCVGDYLNDMKLAQDYAKLNRQTMLQLLDLDVVETFETVHNYINFDDMILRKGAIQAKGKVLIPANMRDGSVICQGLENKEWNTSAPHGSGRLMSRAQAKKSIDLDKFKTEMKNVISDSVRIETLDESPFVYKDTNEILSLIDNVSVKVVEKLSVVANHKGF